MPFDHCRGVGLVSSSACRGVSRVSRRVDGGMHTVLKEFIVALPPCWACGGESILAFGCDGRIDVARRLVEVGVKL
jgi:hypothetical protein